MQQCPSFSVEQFFVSSPACTQLSYPEKGWCLAERLCVLSIGASLARHSRVGSSEDMTFL